jgi:hypothetical protein
MAWRPADRLLVEAATEIVTQRVEPAPGTGA